MKFSTSQIFASLVLGLGLGFNSVAVAGGGGYHSGHFCQEMGSGQNVFLSPNGQMIAIKSFTRITCPIVIERNPDRNLHVIVNYTANGPTQRILCQIVRTNFKGQFDKGEERGARDKQFGSFELSASDNLGGGLIVGANLECTITKDASIIGYNALFRD